MSKKTSGDLIQLLLRPNYSDDDWFENQYWAAEELGNRGDVSAVPALAEALGCEEPDVRYYSAISLAKIGTPDVLLQLAECAYKEVDADTMSACINSIVRIMKRCGCAAEDIFPDEILGKDVGIDDGQYFIVEAYSGKCGSGEDYAIYQLDGKNENKEYYYNFVRSKSDGVKPVASHGYGSLREAREDLFIAMFGL